LERVQRIEATGFAAADAGEAFLDAAFLAQYHVDVQATRLARLAFMPLGPDRRKVAVGDQPAVLVRIQLDVMAFEQAQQFFLECRTIHADSRQFASRAVRARSGRHAGRTRADGNPATCSCTAGRTPCCAPSLSGVPARAPRSSAGIPARPP